MTSKSTITGRGYRAFERLLGEGRIKKGYTLTLPSYYSCGLLPTYIVSDGGLTDITVPEELRPGKQLHTYFWSSVIRNKKWEVRI